MLIDRLSTGRSITKGRSYCEKCKKTLKPIDLIPIFSYIFLIGRCKHCKAHIPIRIFVVEMLSGIIFALLYFQVASSLLLPLSAICLSVILLCFVGIFFADLEYGIIPDLLVIGAILASFFYLFFQGLPMPTHVLSGLGSFAFFLLLFVVTKGRGMGLGDVKFAFVLGLLLGSPMTVVSLYLAFLTGAGVSIILVICKKLRFFGSTIPFGPFLVVSTIITLFYGDALLKFFLQKFF